MSGSQRLASDPEFFCELIRLIYRSNKTNITTNEPTEKTKAIATNAYRLLHEWRTPPGMKEDGSFNDAHFSDWVQRMKEICSDSGHLEVAFIQLGQVLIYCPSDTSGLWINQTVANALNVSDAKDMRDGFRTGIYNSRGAHWVDPTGKPELELAEQYRQKAEQVENAGYQRFAVTLRSLSESYEREAQQVGRSNWLEEG